MHRGTMYSRKLEGGEQNMATTREDLYRVIDTLPGGKLPLALRLLECLHDDTDEEELSPEVWKK